MNKALLIFVFTLSFSLSVYGQQTWIPENDYRLYESPWRLQGVELHLEKTQNGTQYFQNYLQAERITGTLNNGGNPINLDHLRLDSTTQLALTEYNISGDFVYIFKQRLRMPNHPKTNTTWVAQVKGSSLSYVAYSAPGFVYDANYQDSVLDITLKIENNGFEEVNHPQNNGLVRYGKRLELIAYSAGINLEGIDTIYLAYSEKESFGTITKSASEVLDFKPGMEFHHVRVNRTSGAADSSLFIHKVLNVYVDSAILNRVDSVYNQRYIHFTKGADSGTVKAISWFAGIDTFSFNPSDYGFIDTMRHNEMLRGFDQLQNNEFKCGLYDSNLELRPVMLGAVIGADTSITHGAIPYYYTAQASIHMEYEEYNYYYPYLGGPYYHYHGVGQVDDDNPVFYTLNGKSYGTPIPAEKMIRLFSNRPKSLQSTVYPNPSNQSSILQLENAGSYYVEIIDIQGRPIESLSFDGIQTELKTAQMENGIYFIRITDGQRFGTIRLEVMH